jgi:hypothetical protein
MLKLPRKEPVAKPNRVNRNIKLPPPMAACVPQAQPRPSVYTSKARYDEDQIEPLGQGVAEKEPIRANRHRCFFREGQSALLGALGFGPPTQGAGDGINDQVETVADQLMPLH